MIDILDRLQEAEERLYQYVKIHIEHEKDVTKRSEIAMEAE